MVKKTKDKSKDYHLYVCDIYIYYMSRKKVPFTATIVDVTAGVCWRMKFFYESNESNRLKRSTSEMFNVNVWTPLI